MTVQYFRLWPRRPPDGSLPLGLSLDDEGLLLAGNCRLIEACLDRDGHLFYRARSAPQLSALLTAAYGEPVDATAIHPAVERISKLMTERNWSRARLAALHLRLPELADGFASARVLEADALLKVTASFDPLKHPRWPKGSEGSQGGEFRPNDDVAVVPVSNLTPDDIDGSQIQAHRHHWHDQAITEKYNAEGLLTPEAYRELKYGEEATTDAIFQNVKIPELRVHMFDDLHRAATAEVREISSDFLEEKGITKENPMTQAQAAELLLRIQSSAKPGISALREAIQQFAETTGNAAAKARARWLEFRFIMPRGGGQMKKGNMPRFRDPEEEATCFRVADRLHDNLLALGLEVDRDYWFYFGAPYRYIQIGFCDRKSLTPAVVIACHMAVADEPAWGIRMGLIDPKTDELHPFASTTADGWTLGCREQWARELGTEVDDQMCAARIGAWRDLPSE